MGKERGSLYRYSAPWFVVATLFTRAPAYAQGPAPAAPPGPAGAQAAPAAAPPVAASARDLVRRTDGGMLRGTIVELVPNEYVVLMLPTGETRRVAMSEVRYAGPAVDEPGASPAPPALDPSAPAADKVAVVFEADQSDVTLQMRGGESQMQLHGRHGAVAVAATSYQRLCTAPCATTLPRGSHRMALSKGGELAVEVGESVQINGPSKLRGVYHSNQDSRTTGKYVFGAGVALGFGLILVPFVFKGDDLEKNVDRALLFIPLGIAAVAAGLIVGGFVLPKRDVASVVVLPYSPPRPPPSPPAGVPNPADARPNFSGALPGGLAIAARFLPWPARRARGAGPGPAARGHPARGAEIAGARREDAGGERGAGVLGRAGRAGVAGEPERQVRPSEDRGGEFGEHGPVHDGHERVHRALARRDPAPGRAHPVFDDEVCEGDGDFGRQ